MEREESQTSSPAADQDTMDNYNQTNTGYSMDYIDLIDWVSLCIELPVLCWAIFALYHQVKANHVAPVFVINLLISDMFQLIGRFGELAIWQFGDSFPGIFYVITEFRVLMIFGITSSVVFMVCIALERYLLVVHPLWYRVHYTIKYSIFISLVGWVSSVILIVLAKFIISHSTLLLFIFMMFPIPLLVFFLVSTWKSLSRSLSVPVKEKKRILCILVLVLGIYIVLFLPSIVIIFIGLFDSLSNHTLHTLSTVALGFVYFNPLMDPLLYIFLKKDVSLKVLPFCGRLIGHQEHRETSSVQTENVTSV